jgi:hypothetical protein
VKEEIFKPCSSLKQRFFNLTGAGLFLFSIGFLLLVANLVEPNATMDSAYYHIMADKLEQGRGFEEPVVWHHLNDYKSLSHPMDYWMPLGIVAYWLSRFFAGAAGEIYLNILLWSLLVTFVYYEILNHTSRPAYAVAGALTLLFCGRNLFYVLTTDNIAIYGFLGYLFIRKISAENPSGLTTGFIAGLIALTRIEGIIFAALGFFWLVIRKARFRVLAIYLLVLLVTISPWLIRNYLVLGKLWTSNTKALFLQKYDDLFDERFPGNFAYFVEPGVKAVLMQRLAGLWNSFLNLFAVPGAFLLYPLWLLGLMVIWKSSGKLFSFLLTVFWLLCGLLFTHQAIKGTSMHISAFFYPGFAVLNGLGLWKLAELKRYKESFVRFIGIVVLIWSLVFSGLSIRKLNQQYENDNLPYKKMLSRQDIVLSGGIVSVYPIYIYYLSGLPGVVSSFATSDLTVATADRFNCDYILLDSRANHTEAKAYTGWESIYKESCLELLKRKK